MPSNKRVLPKSLHIAGLSYLFLVAFLFYLLFGSRSGEVYTVWQVLHPAFLPIFFVTTVLLLTITFSSAKVEYKLLFVIIHSILSHALLIIIFPAGDIGVQQMLLGRTRLVFDNVTLGGYAPWPAENILAHVYFICRGINFQAALSVIFARMFGVDVYWVHLLLVPILWGTFVPAAMFMITKLLDQSDSVSVLSSLLLSVLPLTIYWGAFSVPNSLGFIFFLFSLAFFLKYLHSDDSKTTLLMMVGFCFVSFLTHFLTGVISFCLLLLAVALRRYENERETAPKTAKLALLTTFIFSASILPFSLVYQTLLYPFHTYFTLEKISGLPLQEIFLSFIFGEYLNYSPGFMLVMLIGPLLGFTGMLYLMYESIKQRRKKNYNMCLLFLFFGFLLFLTDYRILKLFMIGVPFKEERLWLFRDFLAVPFLSMVVAFVGSRILALPREMSASAMRKIQRLSQIMPSIHLDVRSFTAHVMSGLRLMTYIIMLILFSGLVTASLIYAYPHWAPLQTTSYEIEAVKHIDKNTTERYIVICDQWMIFAGQMFVGVNNPQSFYFSSNDPQGVALFIKMKYDPSNETMIEATKINNATTTYFIIERPRLGAESYDHIKSQAIQNGVQTYQTFYYKGEEKLCIFFYTKD
jgi:hypothetical protein